MQRDSIIQIAEKWIGTDEDSTEYLQGLLREMNAVPGVSLGEDDPWCAGFVSYCYSKAGCGDLIPMTTYCPTQKTEAEKMGIFKAWPSSESDRLALLKSLKPADVVNWYGHTALVYQVEVGSTVASSILHTLDGNSDNKVKINHRTNIGSNQLQGFLCPDLSGSSEASYQFKGRDQDDLSSCLYLSKFQNVKITDSDAYEISCYMSSSANGVKGENTSSYKNDKCSWCALPNMGAYCQGRAKELWSIGYEYGFIYSKSDLGDRFPGDGYGTRDIMMDQSGKYYSFNQTGSEDTDDGVRLVGTWEDYTMQKSPFQENGGYDIVGSAKQILKSAISNNLPHEFFCTPSNDSLTSFSSQKNDSCVPKIGAIAIWSDGPINNSARDGYCGVVEKIKADGMVMISFSGLNDQFFSTHWMYPWSFANGSTQFLNNNTSSDSSNRASQSGIFFVGYIYPPSGISYDDQQYQFVQLDGGGVTTERIWI